MNAGFKGFIIGVHFMYFLYPPLSSWVLTYLNLYGHFYIFELGDSILLYDLSWVCSIAVCVTRYLFGYSTKFHSESRGCSLVPFTCKEDSANLVAHVNSIILWEQYDIVHQLLLFLIYRMPLRCRDLPLLWLLFHRQSNNPDLLQDPRRIPSHSAASGTSSIPNMQLLSRGSWPVKLM